MGAFRCRSPWLDYRPIAGGELPIGFRLRNAKDLLRYGFYQATLGDRVRLLAALEEMGSLTVAKSMAAFQEGRLMPTLFHPFRSYEEASSLSRTLVRTYEEAEMAGAPAEELNLGLLQTKQLLCR